MAYDPTLILDLAETTLTLANNNLHWCYAVITVVIDEETGDETQTAEIVVSETHIDPLDYWESDGLIYYKLGHFSPVVDGKREAHILWNSKQIPEAPKDGKKYARKDGAWSEVVEGGGTPQVNGLGMSDTVIGDLGLPSEVNSTTVNEVTATSHTHKLGNVNITDVSQKLNWDYLYNWWIGVDERKVTSSDDWIVSTKVSIEDLLDYCGGSSVAGGKLKEEGLLHWDYPNVGATNDFGFSAVGGGLRDWDGSFILLGDNGFLWSSDEYSSEGGYSAVFYRQEVYVVQNNNLKTLGLSIRLCNPSTLLSEGEAGSYIGNNGTVYSTIVINGIEWLDLNLAETEWRDHTPINYIPKSEDWIALTTSAYCIYTLPLSDLLIPEHNTLKGLDGGDHDNNFFGHLTEAELEKVQSLGSEFQVHIKFEAVEAFTYTCPYALKFTAMIYQQTNAPTLSVALDTNMVQYDDLVITPDEIGLVTLTGEWL